MIGRTAGTVDVGGAELYYEVGGEGRVLVLLHDGLLDRRVWDGQFEALSRLYRTVRYDRRGYGASSASRSTFSDASDLHCLLRHLGIDEACLVGSSSGGRAALEFAVYRPEMVGAMVLVGPDLDGYRPSEERRRRVSGLLAVARERGIEAGVEAWMQDPFYPPAPGKTAAREKVRRLAAENLPRLLAAPNLRRGPTSPVIEELPRIVAPVLIMVGERDDRDNLAIASILEEKLPRAEKRIVSNSGHLVNLEAPELFARSVTRWLEGSGSPLAG